MQEKLKDPNAVLDYVVDWSSWLATGETISTSNFTVGSGLTKDSQTNNATTATVWLSGGSDGVRYLVTSRITTNQGRTNDKSFLVRVSNQ